MDEFGGHHHQPARSRTRRPRSPEKSGMRTAFAAVKDFIKENSADDRRAPPPRRTKSYRDPRPPLSDSDSDDAPQRRRTRRSPERHGRGYREDDYDDPNAAQRRRRARDDEYHSDSRYDRPRGEYDDRRREYDARPPRRRDDDERGYGRGYDERPRRREYDDRGYDDRRRRDEYERRDRDRYDERVGRDGRRRGGAGKDVPEWQRQAKDMFYTHALPVIKKEGPKLIMKYAGDFLGNKGGARR